LLNKVKYKVKVELVLFRALVGVAAAGESIKY